MILNFKLSPRMSTENFILNVETAPSAGSSVYAATPLGRGTSARFARFGATPMKTPGTRSSQWRMEGHPACAVARLLGEDAIGSAVWSFLVPSARPAKLDRGFRFVRAYRVEIEGVDGSSTLYSGDYYRHSSGGGGGAVEERWCELQPRKQVVKSDPHTRHTRRTLRKIRSTAKKKQLDAAPDAIAVRVAAAAAKDAETAAKAERTQMRANLAQRLVNGLKDEGIRWTHNVGQLDEKLRVLVGDVVVASSFIAYIAPFNAAFRSDLWSGK